MFAGPPCVQHSLQHHSLHFNPPFERLTLPHKLQQALRMIVNMNQPCMRAHACAHTRHPPPRTLHSCSGSCVFRSQKRTLVSPLPLASCFPSGLKLTCAWCTCARCLLAPVARLALALHSRWHCLPGLKRTHAQNKCL